MNDRGMKKWAPYASLIEQKGSLAMMRHERSKVKRPHISADQAELIERQLVAYDGSALTITFFDDGFIKTCRTKIIRIDPLLRQIECEERRIAYKDILSLQE